ncbi:MAG: AAA family ATPase, partial [Clostridia bacterium]|nr:AAA family ATPase [Clostridia bacterium]
MVISLVNLKGGVGKTVSTINIASAVADKGKKVLIVDTDSQGNIATAMGFNPDEIQLSLANLMVESIAHRI